jgi:hypothetical protein
LPADQEGPKLPKAGERVRVTLRRDIESWEGKERVVIPAGTSYEGVAAHIETEGFFDVMGDGGQQKKFYIFDSSIQVEVLSAAPVA